MLAGLNVSSAVESGMGVTIEAAADVTVHGRRPMSCFLVAKILFIAVLVHPDGVQAIIVYVTECA